MVVGIFLAFQVDRWYENRRVETLESDRINALIEEFRLNRADLEFNLERHERVIESVLSFVELGDTEVGSVTHDEFYTLLAGVNINPTFQAARSTYDLLTATSEIDLLRDTDLRRRLAEFYTEAQRAENRDRQILQRVNFLSRT